TGLPVRVLRRDVAALGAPGRLAGPPVGGCSGAAGRSGGGGGGAGGVRPGRRGRGAVRGARRPRRPGGGRPGARRGGRPAGRAPRSGGGGGGGPAMTGRSLGPLVGPPLGGLLYAWGGPRFPFLVAAAWTALLTAVLYFLLPRRQGGAATRTPPTLLPAGGWRGYVRPLAMVALGSVYLSALEPTLPVHLERRLGARPAQVGLLFGLAALAYGVVSPLAGWWSDRRGTRQVVVAGLCACVLSLPLVALPHCWGWEMVALSV